MTRVALMWLIQAQFAGYFLAARDVPELEFVPRSFDSSPVRELEAGNAEFGVISPAQILAAGEAADGLVLLALIMDRSPLVLVGLRERVGTDLRTLERPRVGVWEGEDVEIRAMLVRGGLPPERTTFVPMGDEVSPLLTGEIDLLQATVYEELPRLVREGADPERLVVHAPRDYGLAVAKDGLVVRRDVLEAQPELVRGVTCAVLRGWLDARSDREAAVRAVTALRPELDPELQCAQLELIVELITPSRALGLPDPGIVEQALEAFDTAGIEVGRRTVAIDRAPWTAAAAELGLTAPAVA